MKVLLLILGLTLAFGSFIPENEFDVEKSDSTFEDDDLEDRQSSKNKTKRVLFIGNSFTFYNGMPDMVRNLAEHAGHKLILDTQTIGGSSLKDHWNAKKRTTTMYKIRDGSSGQPWDIIVLNEQSSRPAYNDTEVCDRTYPYAEKLTNYIRKYNPKAKIQWYMTWGWKNGFQKRCAKYPAMCSYDTMQKRVEETYMTMACSLKPCRVAPVGLAFAQYKKDFGTEEPEEFMKLFQHDEDDHHSSNKGSYLAACVHYSMIFGEPCTGNSYQRSWRAGKDNDKTYTITKANTRKLQETADKIVGTKDLRMNYVFHKSNDKCQRSACPLSSICE